LSIVRLDDNICIHVCMYKNCWMKFEKISRKTVSSLSVVWGKAGKEIMFLSFLSFRFASDIFWLIGFVFCLLIVILYNDLMCYICVIFLFMIGGLCLVICCIWLVWMRSWDMCVVYVGYVCWWGKLWCSWELSYC